MKKLVNKRTLAFVLSLALLVCAAPFGTALAAEEEHFVSVWPADTCAADVTLNASGNAPSTINTNYTVRPGGSLASATLSIDDTVYHGDSGYSYKIPLTGLALYQNIFRLGVTYTAMPLTKGKTYQLSYWIKKDTYDIKSTYLYLLTQYRNGDTQQEGAQTNSGAGIGAVANTTEWQKVTNVFTYNDNRTPTDNQLTQLIIDVRSFSLDTTAGNVADNKISSGNIWIDDISFTEVPDETEYLTILTSKDYIYDQDTGKVASAKFVFDTQYVDEGSVVPSIGACTAKKTYADGGAAIEVFFAEPVAASGLTFTIKDIWGRAIADTITAPAMPGVSIWPADICNGTASTISDKGTVSSSTNPSYTLRPMNSTAHPVVDSSVSHDDNGSSYKFSLAGYPALNSNSIFGLRVTYQKNQLQNGKTYRLSYWIKKNSYDITSTFPVLTWKYDDAASKAQMLQCNSEDGIGTISNTSDWQKVEHTFTYVDLEQPIDIRLYELTIDVRSLTFDEESPNISGDALVSGDFWIDDICLEEVRENPSTALVSSEADGTELTLTFDTPYVDESTIAVSNASGAITPTDTESSVAYGKKIVVLTFADAADLTNLTIGAKDLWGEDVALFTISPIKFAVKPAEGSAGTHGDLLNLVGQKDVTLSITADVTGMTAGTDAHVYLTSFKNGEIAEYARGGVDGDGKATIELDVDEVTPDITFKTFLWEANTLRPLCK